jgi:nitrite reductase (NADH) small subunit
MNWYRITAAENIPLREGRHVKAGSREIAIFNRPHSGGPLCDGIVSGDAVVCPLHGWRISLHTRAVLKPDSTQTVKTYPVTVNQGIVCIQLPEEARRERAA